MTDDRFTEKAPEVEDLMASIAGKRRQDASRCVFEDDGRDHSEGFRDPLSRKEFGISGLCQVCQDSVFGVEEE